MRQVWELLKENIGVFSIISHYSLGNSEAKARYRVVGCKGRTCKCCQSLCLRIGGAGCDDRRESGVTQVVGNV